MNLRVKGQGAPAGRNSRLPHGCGSRTLGAKDEVEVSGFLQAPFGLNVGVDGPEERRMEVGTEAVGTPVVDIHEKVILIRTNLIHLIRQKMIYFVLSLEGALAVDPGRVRPILAVKNDSDLQDIFFFSWLP
jgi:hypothetical protein